MMIILHEKKLNLNRSDRDFGGGGKGGILNSNKIYERLPFLLLFLKFLGRERFPKQSKAFNFRRPKVLTKNGVF